MPWMKSCCKSYPYFPNVSLLKHHDYFFAGLRLAESDDRAVHMLAVVQAGMTRFAETDSIFWDCYDRAALIDKASAWNRQIFRSKGLFQLCSSPHLCYIIQFRHLFRKIGPQTKTVNTINTDATPVRMDAHESFQCSLLDYYNILHPALLFAGCHKMCSPCNSRWNNRFVMFWNVGRAAISVILCDLTQLVVHHNALPSFQITPATFVFHDVSHHHAIPLLPAAQGAALLLCQDRAQPEAINSWKHAGRNAPWQAETSWGEKVKPRKPAWNQAFLWLSICGCQVRNKNFCKKKALQGFQSVLTPIWAL